MDLFDALLPSQSQPLPVLAELSSSAEPGPIRANALAVACTELKAWAQHNKKCPMIALSLGLPEQPANGPCGLAIRANREDASALQLAIEDGRELGYEPVLLVCNQADLVRSLSTDARILWAHGLFDPWSLGSALEEAKSRLVIWPQTLLQKLPGTELRRRRQQLRFQAVWHHHTGIPRSRRVCPDLPNNLPGENPPGIRRPSR